ncbi:peroxiredoxin family protein [Oceanobacillus piezotolerans]|nr:redoxin domain-containing protein [Oceanobacillus piezotolerans]
MAKKIFILLLMMLLIVPTGSVMAKENTGLEVGNQAPDFELESLTGEKVTLSDYRGKAVMLNFWATWCPPCRDEMPDMQNFYDQNDVVVLAVNLTDTEIKKSNVQKFKDEFSLSFPIALDVEGSVALQYRISPIPTTYMIDPEGKITYKGYGAMTYEAMVEKLSAMEL